MLAFIVQEKLLTAYVKKNKGYITIDNPLYFSKAIGENKEMAFMYISWSRIGKNFFVYIGQCESRSRRNI